jgi:hypothetical protein
MGPLRKRAAILRPSNSACRARGFPYFLALILALVVNIAQVDAGEILVGSQDELRAALERTRGGETVLLAPGNYRLNASVPYGSPWAAFPSNVTLRSADPANRAVMTGVQLRGATNLHFDGLVFQHTANRSLKPSRIERETPFLVNRSRNISFTNSTFRGDFLDRPGHVHDALPVAMGLNVRDSRNINVADNHFQDWARGLGVARTSDMQVTGNLVEKIRVDGFTFAAVQNVLIEDNHLRDFNSVPESRDHRDKIQFWTSGTSRPTTDVVIRGNILDSGDGIQSQSIFMRNERVDSGGAGQEMYYRNILIEDNFIHNAHRHGITVGEAIGLEIRNNTLLHNADSSNRGGVSEPSINLKSRSRDVVVEGNIAHDFPTVPDSARDWTLENNLTVQRRNPLRPNYYDEFFVNARAGAHARPEDFAVLPGSLPYLNEIGAPITRFTGTPKTLTARILGSSTPGIYGGFRFDGGLSAAPSGILDGGRAHFVWDFGDGTVAEGLTAEHVFTTWGDNLVTLTVTYPDGSTDTVRTRVHVPNPQRLMLEASAGGVFDTSRPDPTSTLPDATIVAEGDLHAIRLSRTDGMSIPRGDVGGIFGLDQFALELMLKAEAGEASRGEIFRVHNNMRLRVGSDGRLTFDLYTASGEQLTLRTQPTSLMNGDWHAFRIVYDGLEGRLLAMLNDEEVGEFLAGEPTGPSAPRRHWDLNFGGIFSSAGFSGLLGSFEVDAHPTELAGPSGFGGGESATLSPDDVADIVLAMIDPAEDASEEIALLWAGTDETVDPWETPLYDEDDADLLAFLAGDDEFDHLFDDADAPAPDLDPSRAMGFLDDSTTRSGFSPAPSTPIASAFLPPAGWLLLGALGGLVLLGRRRPRTAPPVS